jgi:hypothetical protein
MYNYSTQLKNEFSPAMKNMPSNDKKSEIFPTTKVENEISNSKKDRSFQEKSNTYSFKRDPKVWY